MLLGSNRLGKAIFSYGSTCELDTSISASKLCRDPSMNQSKKVVLQNEDMYVSLNVMVSKMKESFTRTALPLLQGC